jgi:hypothetical protein
MPAWTPSTCWPTSRMIHRLRAAMREMAISDTSDLVRNAARQAGDGGDAEVREYIVAIVKNASLSPAQRLPPPVINGPGQLKNTLRDEDVVRALLDILPALVRDTSQTMSMMKAVGGLSDVRTPSVVDTLLAVLRAAEDASTDPNVSGIIAGVRSSMRTPTGQDATLIRLPSGIRKCCGFVEYLLQDFLHRSFSTIPSVERS